MVDVKLPHSTETEDSNERRVDAVEVLLLFPLRQSRIISQSSEATLWILRRFVVPALPPPAEVAVFP